MRRKDRAAVLVDDAEPWDLIGRRRGAPRPPARRRQPAGGRPEHAAQADAHLKTRTQGLVLLTATPMQGAPDRGVDLLDLLGLPPEWTAPEFLDFLQTGRSAESVPGGVRPYGSALPGRRRDHGAVSRDTVQRLTGLSHLKLGRCFAHCVTRRVFPAAVLRHPSAARPSPSCVPTRQCAA